MDKTVDLLRWNGALVGFEASGLVFLIAAALPDTNHMEHVGIIDVLIEVPSLEGSFVLFLTMYRLLALEKDPVEGDVRGLEAILVLHDAHDLREPFVFIPV